MLAGRVLPGLASQQIVANHKKSESYKAVLNFFRNTLGYDRKLIGQLVRYAVDRIAIKEFGNYLRSNQWLDKIGGRKELNNLIIEAIRSELRLKTSDWINKQLDTVRIMQSSQVEAKKALADMRAVTDSIGTRGYNVSGEYSLDRDNYNKLLASLARLEELL